MAPAKTYIERYRTKAGKLYLPWWHLFDEVDGKAIFSDGLKPTTKEAREYMTREHPECTNYILIRSAGFFGYEVFVEMEEFNRIRPGTFSEKELAQYRIKANSLWITK